jgi:hypothetical protein
MVTFRAFDEGAAEKRLLPATPTMAMITGEEEPAV